MRALLRTVTASGSPARTSKAKQPSTPSVEQIIQICTDIRNALDGTQSQKVKTAENRVARLDTLLEALVDTLVTEASLLSSTETTGECMEYILTHDVLSTIVTASLQDSPPGALGVTLKAFGNLITLLGDTFIAYSHKPIITLVVGASGYTSKPYPPSSASSAAFPGKAYEKELASLLCSLCARLKAHSELLPIFFSRNSEKHATAKTSLVPPSVTNSTGATTLHVLHSPLPSPSPSATSEVSTSQWQKQTQDGFSFPSGSNLHGNNSVKATSSSDFPAQYTFPILSILLTFLARPGQIGDFARQGILFLCELAHQLEAGQESASLRAQRRKLRKKREERNIKKDMPDWSFDSSLASFTGGSVLDRGNNDGQGSKQADLADYISKSDFADLLGASMGAVFSTLPRKIYIAPPGHSLEGLVNTDPSNGTGTTSKKIADFDTLYQKSLVEQLHEESVFLASEDEVQDGLSLLLKLVEFAQDVLKRVSSASVSDNTDSKGYYLGSRIVSSVRTALLENTLYPILQEVSPLQQAQVASTGYPLSSTSPRSPKFTSSPSKVTTAADQTSRDSALLAVFYYLERLLDVLDPDTRLAETVLEFLVSKDRDDREVSGVLVLAQEDQKAIGTTHQAPSAKQHQRASQSISSIHDLRPPSLSRNPTSATSGLLTLHGAAHTPKRFSSAFATHHRSKSAGLTSANLKRWHSGLSIVSTSFDNDLGRNVPEVPKVNLRDLLFHVLASSPPLSAPTSSAVPSSSMYRNSALKVLSLQILHVILTRFDLTSTELLQTTPKLGCTNFPFDVRRVLAEEAKYKEDEGEFKYPTSDDDDEGSEAESFVYPGEEGRKARKYSADKANGTGSQELDVSEIALLLSLALPKGSGDSSTDYSAYLKDAEIAIQSDRSFQRGLTISSAYLEENSEDTSTALSSALSSTSSSARTPSKVHLEDPMLQHILQPPHSSLLSFILDNLCDFFANTPEENLLLTALVAKLASCPYRSLEGWLLPSTAQLHALVKQNFIDAKKGTPIVRTRKISSNSDTSSASSTTRKAPIPLFLLSGRLPSEKTEEPPSGQFGEAAPEMPVFAILSQLCDAIDQVYAIEVTNFDRYLEERRRGMSFVEDLAEALEFTTDALEDEPPAISRSSTATRLGLPTLVNSFSTPTKKVANSKKASKSSLASGGYTSQEGLSPYALHYTHTESVRVTPRKAISPLSSAAHLGVATSPNLLASPSSDNGSDGGFETPTKPSQHAQSSSQTGRMGHRAKQSSISSQLSATSKKKRQMDQTVTLSMLLDNVIILEEAIKELIAIVVVRKRLGIDNVI